MSERILKGKPVALEIKLKAAIDCQKFKEKTGKSPKLSVLMVDNEEGGSTTGNSLVYLRSKQKACEEIGIELEICNFPWKKGVSIEAPKKTNNNTLTDKLLEKIQSLNNRPDVHGILIEMPLPKEANLELIAKSIHPKKDIDGLNPFNLGLLAQDGSTAGRGSTSGSRTDSAGCTPLAALAILDFYEIPIAGKEITILGRSRIVGLPLALLLLSRNGTITICHSKTKDLALVAKKSQILISAMGKPWLVREEFLNPDQVVIDIGTNTIGIAEAWSELFQEGTRSAKDLTQKGYTILGDVYEQAALQTAAFTPVPGGVGPVTAAILIQKVAAAAWSSLDE